MENIFKHELRRNAKPNPVATTFMELLYSDPHPARTIEYDQLILGLQRAVKNKTVLAKKDKSGKLTIYNYIANTWGFFECLARGLVIDEENRRIVATPFPKFFNYGEITNAFPSGPFQAAEKMDGSLGVVFCHEGTWQVATRGSFQSSQAEWATEWFQSNVSNKISQQHCLSTILVEIIYPENQIVIDYDFSGLVLLGAYHANGREYSRSELEELATEVGIRLAKLYQFESVADVLQSATSLPGDKEGWVLRFPSGYRMKIKGDEYCNLHRSHSMCTPLNIWNTMMKSNEDMKKFSDSMPEEFAVDVGRIEQNLERRMDECLEILAAAIQATSHLSPKELGLLSPNSNKKQFPKPSNTDSLAEISVPSKAEEETAVIPAWTLPFLFQSKKKEFQNGAMLTLIWDHQGNVKAQRLRAKVFERFRPMNNSLDGYIPTGVTNRFANRLEETRSNQATAP
ncbi:unnamed protein product [Cylindrotheca closterium]|uniref:T4 RNA ligase 1-like N-terminal domain-containing protein n=1 Tax=Cylindrotheca closterium TaxID=2856 RepID=A0AAD2FJH1_9STRA|nr:unnamed protein product [Cylindrotheca closterium]